MGIGIVINELWHAWTLKSGWNKDGRDIGWAEAVGFKLLVYAVAAANPQAGHIRVFGDNQGAVEG
jgi:hypothetical protein